MMVSIRSKAHTNILPHEGKELIQDDRSDQIKDIIGDIVSHQSIIPLSLL
jgi:hypothetical protein